MAPQLVGRSGEDAAVDPSANSMDDLIGGGGAAVDRSALVDDPAPAEDGEAAQLGDDSPNELLLITSSFEHQHENRREWQKVRDSVSSSPRSLRAKSGSPHSCVTVSPMACGKRAEERLAILEDFEKRLKAANAWALQTDDPHFIIHSITHQSLASHDDENEEHQRRLLAESRGSPSPLSPPMAKIFLPPMAKSQRPSPSPRLPPDGENASAVDGYSNGDALSEEKRSREEMLREPQEMTRQLHYQQTPYTPFTPYMPSSPPSLANGDPSSSGWQVRAQPETEREGGREGEEGREREGGREREREPPYQQMPYTPYTPYKPSLANGELHGGSWGPVRSLAVTPPPPPVTSTTSFARGFNFVASDTQQVTPSVSLLPLQ